MRLLLLALALMATPALADDAAMGGMPAPIAAGPAHEHFKAFVGNWKVEITMNQPDGTALKSEGKQTSSLVLGGLGMAFEHESMMGPMKMLGHGFSTWIPGKNKYESYWMDNMSQNGMSHGWATWDDATQTLTEVMTGPGPDGKEMSMTMVTKVESADKHTSTFMMKGPDGKDFPMMMMVYTRVK